MEILLTRFHWLQLSNEQRMLMREAFDIPRSGGVEMQGNKMMSDGSNENDLRAVNVESMQKFLDSKDATFEVLYNATIAKIDMMLQTKRHEEEEKNSTEFARQRDAEISYVVVAMIETFNGLPVDAQNLVRSKITKVTTPITNVQESTSTKEGKKGSNKRSSEGSGEGDHSSEGAS